MCGIAGTYGFGNLDLLRAMTDTLVHRGPDGEGLYQDDPVLLGNRRLAIMDVEGGAQPMRNEDETVVVVYNGEIYNYPELRAGLVTRGHVLTTHCDTEILPHLYEDEGIEFARRLNGIFAFALWDRPRQTLFLVRDPLGVKPLVYAARDGRLAFGSEAKAVLRSGLVPADIDELSLHLSMNVRYVPGDRTLFKAIRRLPPGQVLEFGRTGIHLRRYAGIDRTPDATLTESEWVDGIREHYEASVRRQLMSDVPVGVSLSGGVDSTSIVAMIRRVHSGPVKTFTLGFNEPWDELGDARYVAERYGTEHHELVLTEPVMPYLEEAVRHTEEPKVNCLQLYLLHRFIGGHVKVVLSGLGGDELFGGYDIYSYLRRSDALRALVPRSLMSAVLQPVLDLAAQAGSALGQPHLDLYVRGLEWLASIHDPARHYLLLRNAWDFNPVLLRRVYTREFSDRVDSRTRESFDDYFAAPGRVESQALWAEFQSKMTCDLLHNEDTMSMAHSVESRVPLLDLDLVRFAARIPDALRFKSGLKGLLKRALAGILPERTLAKRKWGFTFDPVEQYKKDLRQMAMDLLTPARLRDSGIFDPRFVQRVLAATPHQRLRWHYFLLWQMIGLELWLDLFVRSGRALSRGSTRTAPVNVATP